MTTTVHLPLWLLILILLFAAVTALSHFLLPSVRWFFRKRMERVVARLNTRLERPIEPFKLARRHDMIQRLIYDPEVAQAIVDHAKEEEVPENVAFELARKYAREIVPSFSASAYFGFAIRAARFLSKTLYRVRLGYYDEDGMSDIDPDATVIFIMNHRSNMDYVLVTYLAAERSALSYAVGEWARVWPLSRFLRSMGAYFIRRKSRNALYRKVLARYVQMATSGGVTQAIFPEGGLSLDGKTAPPKLGLLNYVVSDFDPKGRDVVFIPVALNYDRVLEDRVLMAASKAGERKFRAGISSIFGFIGKQIWLRVTGQFHRFGYASVSFGSPVSLRALVKGKRKDVVERVGQELMQHVQQIVPVVPVPIVASILLKSNGTMSRADVETQVADMIGALDHAHVHLPRADLTYAAEVGLRMLTLRRAIVEEDGIITLNPKQTELLQFYANSIAHLETAESKAKSTLKTRKAPQ